MFAKRAEKAKTQPPGARDLRAQHRYSHMLKAGYRPLGAENAPFCPAVILDVSQGGMSLVVEEKSERGKILVLKLEGIEGRFERPLLIRVANARPYDDNLWRIGCAFVTPLREPDVQELLLFNQERGPLHEIEQG